MLTCGERDVEMWFVVGPLSTTTGGDTKVVPWDKQHLHQASQVGLDTFLYVQFNETKYLIPKQKSLLHDKQVVSIGIPCHSTQAEYLISIVQCEAQSAESH